MLNLSSEAADPLYFTGIGFPVYHPFPILGGGQYTVQNCAGVEFSVASQAIADLLATANSIICGARGQAPAVIVPSPGVIPPAPFRAEVFNFAKTGIGACSTWSNWSYTVPAGTFTAVVTNPLQMGAAQAAVDAHAQAYVDQRVSSGNYSSCMGTTNPNKDPGTVAMCVGVVFGSTNLFVVNGTPGAVHWSSNGLPPGISLSPGTTQSITDASGDNWTFVGQNHWFNGTTGSTQVGQPKGTLSGNIGTADLFGVPTQAGNYPFTIKAVSSNGDWTNFTGVISVLGFTTPKTLPTVDICTLMNIPLQAAGGTSPYSFADPGVLPMPNGLSVQNGAIHGQIAAGTYHFQLVVTDNFQQQCTQVFTLTVTPAATQPSITTPNALPNGHANSRYQQLLAITGGCPASILPPYTLSLIAGALPFTFHLQYGGGWYLYGFPGPAQVGSYGFTIQVTDNAGQTATKAFTLTIDNDVASTITCPSAPFNVATGTQSPGNDINGHAYDSDALTSLAQAKALNNLVNNGCPMCNMQVNSVPRTNSLWPSVSPTSNAITSTCAVYGYIHGQNAGDTIQTVIAPSPAPNWYTAWTNQTGVAPTGVYEFWTGPARNGTLLFTFYF